MTTTPYDVTWNPRLDVADRVDVAGDKAVARKFEPGLRRLRIRTAAATSPAPGHLENEDAHSELDRSQTLFVVADGVGGGALASWVSSELASQLHAKLEATTANIDTVRAALIEADRSIARTIAARGPTSGAATVALCKCSDDLFHRWLIAWVGDCRVYRVTGKQDSAEQLTRDDSYQNLAEKPPRGAYLEDPARMVGNGAIDVANVRTVELDAGELLILCSDGVHKHATSTDIRRMLLNHEPLAQRCRRLIQFVAEQGCRDDATVLAIERLRRSVHSPESL